MLKKMNLDKQKVESDSSDYEDIEEPVDMDVDATVGATKSIKKKKPLPRSYYQAMKKNLRRQAKSGILPNIAQLDELLAKMEQD